MILENQELFCSSVLSELSHGEGQVIVDDLEKGSLVGIPSFVHSGYFLVQSEAAINLI